MIVLVTGGRDYAGPGLAAELDRLRAEHLAIYLVVGDATGADAIAYAWAVQCMASGDDLPWPVAIKHEAHVHGRGAGPVRNAGMVDHACAIAKRTGMPVLCLAASGGRGTEDCVRRAVAAGLEVRRVA